MKSNKPTQQPDLGLFHALIWCLPIAFLFWGMIALVFVRACQ